MYRCQLNYSLFAVTSAVAISWQHINHPNLLVRAVHELRISLPHEDGFNKVENDYERSAYYSVCDEYGVNPDETWMHDYSLYTTGYAIFGHEVKAPERSPPDNITKWIITQSKGFTKKCIEKIRRSVMAYVYLVFSSQAQARSTIVGNSVPAVDAQQLFKDTLKSLIREDLTIDIEKYQGVLEHPLSKVDFSVRIGIYMLPSNLNLAIAKKEGYNNKILVSNTDRKTGLNKDINKDHKKFPVVKPDVARHDPVGKRRPYNLNLRMLTEKHNDEKLAVTVMIVGARLIAYHFLLKKMPLLLLKIGGVVVNALAFSDTNFLFSRLTDDGPEEHKRHDLALEKLQKARYECNKDQMKRLDPINKILHEGNKARAYIKNVDEAMLEY